MAVRMKQDTVIEFIRTAVDSPINVMVMPSSFPSDGFATDGTDAPLSGPEVLKPGLVPEVDVDLTKLTFFKVKFPLWIERISSAANLDVTLDRQSSD